MIKLRRLVCKFYFQDYHEVSDERVNTCKKNCFYASTWSAKSEWPHTPPKKCVYTYWNEVTTFFHHN